MHSNRHANNMKQIISEEFVCHSVCSMCSMCSTEASTLFPGSAGWWWCSKNSRCETLWDMKLWRCKNYCGFTKCQTQRRLPCRSVQPTYLNIVHIMHIASRCACFDPFSIVPIVCLILMLKLPMATESDLWSKFPMVMWFPLVSRVVLPAPGFAHLEQVQSMRPPCPVPCAMPSSPNCQAQAQGLSLQLASGQRHSPLSPFKRNSMFLNSHLNDFSLWKTCLWHWQNTRWC